MIDFRYHLVSIVAVFLALAVGIVLGSIALQPSALKGLQTGYEHEQQQIDHLIATGKLNRKQLAADEAFARAAEPHLLAHLLEGQRVVIVAAPGAPSGVTAGIVRALGEAGAAVSGEVQMQSRFFNSSPAVRQVLSQVAQQAAPATLALPAGSAVAEAGKVLASAILTNGDPAQPLAGVADGVGKNVLSQLSAAGFLSVANGHPAARATLAVVLTPASPPAASASTPASEYLVTLAQQLRSVGQGTVVAAPVAGSGAGSAIDVMRTGGRQGHLSSVDDADMVTGQITVVQALYEQLRGVSGSYGINGANGAGPSPAPTPSPSPSASSVTTRSQRAAPRSSPTGRH